MNQHSLQDPVTQYPAPNIPEQTQQEPGLDQDMTPLADHGDDSYEGAGRLGDRKALITGGDSGIGRAVAIAFIREGAHVVVNYLTEEQADFDDLKASLGDAGERLHGIPGDISDETFCQKLVTEAHSKMNGLDIVVNNAGKQVSVESISDLSSEQLKKTFETNVFALIWIVKAALEYVPKGTSIINTTSIQATQPSPHLIDYAATKAAITNLTRNLAQQLAEKGIRVNAVAPGPIWTPLQPSHGQPKEKLTKFGEDTPYGRPGQPAELAPLYVFLASQESSYVSGEVIGATGGKPR